LTKIDFVRKFRPKRFHEIDPRWESKVSLDFNFYRRPGGVYNGKFYLVNDNNQAEVYDPVTGGLSGWESPPVPTGEGACLGSISQNSVSTEFPPKSSNFI
jgi:hypothetical protein